MCTSFKPLSWYKGERGDWLGSNCMNMIDAHIFLFRTIYSQDTIPPDYWGCEAKGGKIYFAYIPPTHISDELTGGPRRRLLYSPTDSLSCSLADLYLTCLATERDTYIASCDTCKALVTTPWGENGGARERRVEHALDVLFCDGSRPPGLA